MSRYRPHPLDQGHPPPWACGWGKDRHGVFVEFAVGDVEQRLRWIEGGTFQMGSPESEAGRDDDEHLHEVTLTEGFWLADTPCTQALWEAVMGTNPSEFVTPDRPVEKVSWEDAQAFLTRLGERVPGLSPRLPTEAEWEYACRAGTETATYAGDLEILGENNAPVLDAIAWYGGNSGHNFDLPEGYDSIGWREKQYDHSKAGTRKVKTRKPNPWGLYDTLGNVWEWCEDWYAPYDVNVQRDPVHRTEGSDRVFRGGSWIFNARNVRAAYRYHLAPSSRDLVLGFRLARGQ